MLREDFSGGAEVGNTSVAISDSAVVQYRPVIVTEVNLWDLARRGCDFDAAIRP